MKNNLISKILSSFKKEKRFNITNDMLPTRGIFYPENIEISVTKASEETIKMYNSEISKTNDDINLLLHLINKVVENHIIVKNSTYHNLKSLDLLYLFIYIVRITTEKPYMVKYELPNKTTGEIELNEENFMYMSLDRISSHFDFYNKEKKQIILNNGFMFSLPSIGIETKIVEFIRANEDKFEFNDLNFIYFMGNGNDVSFEEIENVIISFEELDSETYIEIRDFVHVYEEEQRFKLLKDNVFVDLKSGLHFNDLW